MNGGDRATRAIVTGASRGLGLEFTRQLLASGGEVFAFARNPDSSDGLQALVTAHPDTLSVGRLDVADERLVEAAHAAVAARWNALDLLINNAGTYGTRDSTLASLDLDEVRTVLETNSFGPLNVTRAFLGLLRRGRSPKLVNMTSLMGSIKDDTSGGAWAYRISKAALNMITRNMGHELSAQGVVCVAMHPGWVKTAMGGARAPLAISDAVASMLATINSVTADRSGEFIDRDGNSLPW